MWRLLLCFVLALGIALPAQASHFRYGSLTWRTVQTDASKRTVQLKVSESWRRSAYGAITVGSTVATDVLYFGDGASSTVNLVVTSVDIAADNFYGEATITHQYAANQNYTAYFSSCCRVSTLYNNANASWYVKSVVNAGTGNNSPVSTLPPVVNLATGQAAATFQLPANDPDGDALTYSLATSADMNNTPFTNAPGLAINATTGVITFNTTTAPVGRLYNATVKVSDGKTSILVDFIIQITKVSAPPVFDYSVTPSKGYVYQVAPGTPVNFSVRATDSDAGDVVRLQGIGLPPGSSMTPSLPVTGNPVQSAFSWTPTLSNLGTSVITFVAQDAVGVQTNTSVTIQVSTRPTFDVPPTPASGSVVQVTPGTLITRTIQASNVDPATMVRIVSATGLPASATYSPALPTPAANPTSTQLSWTPVVADWGLHTATFTATNSYNDQSTHSLQFIVNSAPSFTSTPSSLGVLAGRPFSYHLTLTDPDLPYGDKLEVETPVLPAWLTLADNGDGTATLSGTPTMADAGSNPVTLVAADTYHHGASYGLITQSFAIEVTACSVQAMAQNVTVQLDANGQATVSGAQVNNGSTATCGIASLAVSPASFSCANVGDNTVTLTVTDASGNVSTATATITVQDNVAPTAVAQNVTVQLDATGQANVTAAQVDNGSTDNCAIASVTVTPSTFTCANVGANPVTLTVTDTHGNVSTATATVTVVDGIAPTAVAQNLTVQLDASGSASITATQINNGSTDNCGVASVSVSPSTFGCTNLGANAVTLTVTDKSGNVSTATATITVQDLLAPTLSRTPANVSLMAQPGDCTPAVSWTAPLAADNCSVTLTSTRQPGTRFPVGTTPVTYTATDQAGNTATYSFTVTVVASPVVVALSSPTYAGGYNIGCAGSSSGSASAAVSGGCQPYRYQWSNGQTTATATGLSAGSYSVTITDANNTSVVRSIVLTEPKPLALSTAYSPQATFQGAGPATVYLGYGQQSLTLNATATGGVAGYSYRWSPATGLSSTSGASVTAAPTATTTYTVTATDQNGCATSRAITVNVVDARCGNKNDKVTVCHNGHEICIDANAVPAHLQHGDNVGPCGAISAARSGTSADATALESAQESVLGPVFEAYPNPNKGTFQVRLQAAAAGQAQVELLDIQGRRVATLLAGPLQAGEARELSVENLGLAEGLYVVRWQSADQVRYLRVSVQH